MGDALASHTRKFYVSVWHDVSFCVLNILTMAHENWNITIKPSFDSLLWWEFFGLCSNKWSTKHNVRNESTLRWWKCWFVNLIWKKLLLQNIDVLEDLDTVRKTKKIMQWKLEWVTSDEETSFIEGNVWMKQVVWCLQQDNDKKIKPRYRRWTRSTMYCLSHLSHWAMEHSSS